MKHAARIIRQEPNFDLKASGEISHAKLSLMPTTMSVEINAIKMSRQFTFIVVAKSIYATELRLCVHFWPWRGWISVRWATVTYLLLSTTPLLSWLFPLGTSEVPLANILFFKMIFYWVEWYIIYNTRFTCLIVPTATNYIRPFLVCQLFSSIWLKFDFLDLFLIFLIHLLHKDKHVN